MIEILQWTKKHRSELERWPKEDNLLLPALMLRAKGEPYDLPVASFALVNDGALVGRFSYRLLSNGVAFVGLVLSPAARGTGVAVPSMRGSLLRLCAMGVTAAFGSVAAANKPALMMNYASGFRLSEVFDWRDLPADFDTSLLAKCKKDTYRLLPVPAMLYRQVYVELSLAMYTGVAQVVGAPG